MMWKKILMSCSVCMMVAMMAVSAFGEIEIQVYKPVETTPGAEFGSDKAVAKDIQDYFLEHTGIKFIPHSLPMDQYAQTLNTVFASGDKMDLFFALQFVRYGYVKNKIYTPITQEMLDQYGPNIKKAWTQETWDYLKDADGNYVGIPRNGVLRNYPTWIRTDWLEKYGLAMPTTVEELEEVLQVFHEKKPAGPGTIPLLTGASDSLNHLRYALMGGWVEPGYHKDGGWLDTDGKIKPAELHPGFQDFLAKMNEWYEKGYLFKESFTMNNGALRKLMQTGKCGVVSYWGSGIGIGYEVIKEVDPEAVYVAAPGIKGPAGFIETIQTPADSGWMIYRDSEYPIEILKAIDFQYSSFEQYLVSELGIKDKQWKWADEEQKVYEQIGDRKYFQEYRYAPGLYMEIQGIMKGGREFWVKHMREEKERYDVAKFPSDLGIVWDMAEVKKNVRRLNDLQRLWDEETTKFIMGIRPLDEYDAFVQQMNKSGLDDWITEYTRQYNALKK